MFCSVLLSLPSCLPLAFPLGSSTGCQPTPLPPPDFPLRVQIFCQTRLPANKTRKPVIEEIEAGLPPSLQQKQPYCICSPWLRATFPGPFTLPPGTYSCAWSKSLQAGVCCHASNSIHAWHRVSCLLGSVVPHNPFSFLSPCLFKCACRCTLLCPIRKLIQSMWLDQCPSVASVCLLYYYTIIMNCLHCHKADLDLTHHYTDTLWHI